MRLDAVGAVSGGLAGGMFGFCAFLIQTALTQANIETYGDAAVDHGAAFLEPSVILSMAVIGGFIGIVYLAARVPWPWLTRWGGVVFAGLMAPVLQVLMSSGYLRFSAVVGSALTGTVRPELVELDKVIDLASPLLTFPLMTALLLLEVLGIHQLARLVSRWMPRLPAAVYAVLAVVIGLPGFALFGLLVLLATGAVGGE